VICIYDTSFLSGLKQVAGAADSEGILKTALIYPDTIQQCFPCRGTLPEKYTSLLQISFSSLPEGERNTGCRIDTAA